MAQVLLQIRQPVKGFTTWGRCLGVQEHVAMIQLNLNGALIRSLSWRILEAVEPGMSKLDPGLGELTPLVVASENLARLGEQLLGLGDLFVIKQLQNSCHLGSCRSQVALAPRFNRIGGR